MSLETTIFDQSDIAEDFIESGLLDRILFNEFKKKFILDIIIYLMHQPHFSLALLKTPWLFVLMELENLTQPQSGWEKEKL